MYLASYTYVIYLASQNTFNKVSVHNKKVLTTLESSTAGAGGLVTSLKKKAKLRGAYVLLMTINFNFLLDSVKNQLSSFKKSGEFIIKECKERSKDNNEIEIRSITEEDGAVTVSENNDGALAVSINE